MTKGVLSASRIPVQLMSRQAVIELRATRSEMRQSIVADAPSASDVLSTGAVPPLVSGPRSHTWLAQRGSSLSGPNGGPHWGSPGARGANGIVAPGQPAPALEIAGT